VRRLGSISTSISSRTSGKRTRCNPRVTSAGSSSCKTRRCHAHIPGQLFSDDLFQHKLPFLRSPLGQPSLYQVHLHGQLGRLTELQGHAGSSPKLLAAIVLGEGRGWGGLLAASYISIPRIPIPLWKNHNISLAPPRSVSAGCNSYKTIEGSWSCMT